MNDNAHLTVRIYFLNIFNQSCLSFVLHILDCDLLLYPFSFIYLRVAPTFSLKWNKELNDWTGMTETMRE